MPGMPADRPGYRLSPLAVADLEEIWLYTLENWSAGQADRYQNDIHAACAAIADGRRHGRKVEARDGYLKAAVGSHFLFYRIRDRSVEIIRVLHQRMDPDSRL